MSQPRQSITAEQLRKQAAQLRRQAQVVRAEETVRTVKAASALEALYRLNRYMGGGR